MLDTKATQSMVAYGSGPKEVNTQRGMHDGNKQFGKANKMPQDNKGYKQPDWPANPVKRGREYR